MSPHRPGSVRIQGMAGLDVESSHCPDPLGPSNRARRTSWSIGGGGGPKASARSLATCQLWPPKSINSMSKMSNHLFKAPFGRLNCAFIAPILITALIQVLALQSANCHRVTSTITTTETPTTTSQSSHHQSSQQPRIDNYSPAKGLANNADASHTVGTAAALQTSHAGHQPHQQQQDTNWKPIQEQVDTADQPINSTPASKQVQTGGGNDASKSATIREHPLEPEYHLSHTSPPSPVPITISRQWLPALHLETIPTRTTPGDMSHLTKTRWNTAGERADSAPATTTVGPLTSDDLVQVQLPLQVHLKLRPLALPMPPPPSVQSKRRRSVGEKKEMSTVSEAGAKSSQATTGAPSLASNRGEKSSVESWQAAAKRVLLLNAIGQPLVQAARLERRISRALADQEPSGVPAPTYSRSLDRLDGPPHAQGSRWRPSESGVAVKTEDGLSGSSSVKPMRGAASDIQAVTRTATELTTSRPPPETTTTSTPTTTTNGAPEVRRQRHSAQQTTTITNQEPGGASSAPHDGRTKTISSEDTDGRIQALAAAMLPFIWPSFQASLQMSNQVTNGGLNGANRTARSRSLSANTSTIEELGDGRMLQPQGGGMSNMIIDSKSVWPSTLEVRQLSSSDRRTRLVSVQPKTGDDSLQASPTTQRSIVFLDQDEQSSATSSIRTEKPSAPVASTTSAPTTTSTSSRPKSSPVSKPAKNKKRRRKAAIQAQQNQPHQQDMASNPALISTSSGIGELYATDAPNSSTSVASPSKARESARSLDTIQSNGRNSTVGQQENRQFQLPIGLLQYIELKLKQLNATFTLMNSRNMSTLTNVGPNLAPTTSISKVIRMQTNAPVTATTSTSTTTTAATDHATATTLRPLDDQVGQQWHNNDTTTTSTTETPRPISSTTSTTSREPPMTTQPARVSQTTLSETTAELGRPSVTTTTTPTIVTTATSHNRLLQLKRQQQRHQEHSQALDPMKSNQVLPDEDELRLQTRPTTGRPPLSSTSGRPNRRGKHPLISNPGQERLKSQNNIKLFHFKRKPDMNKLPFYKRPLNFTELGWSREQIQEHLLNEFLSASKSSESSGLSIDDDHNDDDHHRHHADSRAPNEAAQAALARSQTLSEPNPASDTTNKESPTGGDAGAVETSDSRARGLRPARQSVDADELVELRLKSRKRRAKGQQFERLMAELQAAGEQSEAEDKMRKLQPQQLLMRSADSEKMSRFAVDHQLDGSPIVAIASKRRDPEPLVMKPMLFVMSQKRRLTNAGSNSTGDQPTGQSGSSLLSSATTTETNATSVRPVDRQDETEALTISRTGAGDQGAGKPMVRMRRKHHGEQPLQLFPLVEDSDGSGQLVSPWRPTRPLGWLSSTTTSTRPPNPLISANNNRVLLVPSGLLTPSGSHLVPFYSSSGQHPLEPLASGQTGGQPAEDHKQASGDRLQVSQPGSQQLASNSTLSEQQHQLRVPKLLMKPMRPAKYSLNGYIPRPSLGLQQQPLGPSGQQALQAAALGLQQLATNQNNQQPTSSLSSGQQHLMGMMKLMKQQHQQAPKGAGKRPPLSELNAGSGQHLAPLTSFSSKDLDSSTSNEIFSRRRGLQGHQARLHNGNKTPTPRETNTGHQKPSAGANPPQLESSPIVGGQSLAKSQHQQQPNQRQLEENRRKYVQQHQQTLASSSFKSHPALSLQKANQIKAKLGLSATSSSSNPAKRSKQPPPVDHEQQPAWPQQQVAASTSLSETVSRDHSIGDSHTSADPESDPASPPSGKQLIGAPLNSIPKTDFECTDTRGRFVSGLFADFKTGCQVWHLCSNNRKYSFLCPSGTIFNAKVRICDWRYNVKCEPNSI